MARPKTNKITAYQADDGLLFTDKTEYLEHQRKLKCMDGIRSIANRIEGDCAYNHGGDFGNNVFVLDADQLADFLFNNSADILAALQGKYLPANSVSNTECHKE